MTIIARILRLRPYIACSRRVIIANLDVRERSSKREKRVMLTNNRRLVNNKKYLVIQLDNPASNRIISIPSNDGIFRPRLPLWNRSSRQMSVGISYQRYAWFTYIHWPTSEDFYYSRNVSRQREVAIEKEEKRDWAPLTSPEETHFVIECEEVIIVEDDYRGDRVNFVKCVSKGETNRRMRVWRSSKYSFCSHGIRDIHST